MRISDWSSDVCSSDLKIIDRGLGAGLRIHALDDDGAGKTGARRAVGQRFTRQATRHYHRIRRNLAHEYLASVAIHNLGGGRDEHPHRSEEHTSELQSLMRISYAVFCLKKKIPYHNKIILQQLQT